MDTLIKQNVMEQSGEAQGARESRRFVVLAWLGFLTAWAVVVFMNNAIRGPIIDHYSYLADAILHGRLYLDGPPPGITDWVYYQGRSYIPFGPFPTLIEMPFVALFGLNLHTMTFTFPLTVLSGWLLWRIFAHLGVVVGIRWWLLLLFFIGSVYSFVIIGEGPWFLAHVATVSLLLAALLLAVRKPLAALGRGEWLAIGLLLGGAFLSRSTAALGALFFVVLLLATGRRERWARAAYLWPMAMLGAGLGVALLLFCAYNYARFGNVLETGYKLAYLSNPQLDQAISYGLFSPSHIPTNFYYMFLAGFNPYPAPAAAMLQFPWFVPSPLGTSILLTTPALLYALRPRWNNPLVVACWAAIIPTMLALLCYYAPGQIQFGYRYTLDFMPFVMVLLALAFRNGISRLARALIVAGVCVCLWGNVSIGLALYDWCKCVSP